MTREEAYRLAIQACRETWNEKTVKQIEEALKQEPCEDAISRQAVKELYYKCGYIDFRKICELPSVTPQPETGHWIIIDDCEQFIAKCSNCGRVEDTRMISRYPYCHCGAKMVGATEK